MIKNFRVWKINKIKIEINHQINWLTKWKWPECTNELYFFDYIEMWVELDVVKITLAWKYANSF